MMKKHNSIITILILGLLFLLLTYPNIAINSALAGINIFAVAVLPALLPFFFFTKLLTLVGAASGAAKLLGRPIRVLYGSPSIGAYVLVMSILSGYPIGAKIISDLHQEKLLSSSQASQISSFTSTSGIIFIVGSVGTIMLGNRNLGLLILLCHILASLINGIIYRKKSTKDIEINIHSINVDNILGEAVYSAVISVLIVGAYISIFYMISELIISLGVISFISNLIPFNSELASGILVGLIEMTRGCIMLSSINSPFVLPLICGVISFGGLSISFQSLTYLKSAGVKARFYFLTKTTQALLSVVLGFIFQYLLYN